VGLLGQQALLGYGPQSQRSVWRTGLLRSTNGDNHEGRCIMKRGLSGFSYLLAALAISACGSSSNTTSSTEPAPTASTAAATSTSIPASAGTGSSTAGAATGAPIVLGSICSCTGPAAASLGDSGKVITAWVKSVNSSGGINGHPVKLTVLDDGENPATSLQDAKELVEQDHVMAIVSDASLVDSSWAKYIRSTGVPVVGGISANGTFGVQPDFYASGSTLIPLLVGTVAEAKGKKNFGVMYCAEEPVCAQLVPLVEGIGKGDGLKVTPQSISATAPSYAAPCLALKSAGVDALYIADNGPTVERVVAGCHQQGYNPLNVVQATTSSNQLLKDPVFNGALLTGTNANPYDASLPAVKAFQDAVNKYDPGLLTSSSFAYDSYSAWTGGALFEAAATAGKLTPTSTPADVKKALYSLKNETLGGLVSPLTFTPGKPAFTPCWFTGQIEGGKFTSLAGDKPTCLPAAQAAALLKSLG
jgi:branched-chain amino acid transport system substrate-binding protein